MSRAYPHTKAEYAAARDRLLERIVVALIAQPAICAAWLAGSLGRGEGDTLSDLDLCIAVEDADAGQLCAYDRRVSSGAPPDRMHLFTLAGKSLSIHENHNNAPLGGTFSSVLYRQPPVIVDWVLIPRSLARRSADTRLLFDRAGIPLGQVPHTAPVEVDLTPEQREAERLAFFWMMAMVAAKYIVRGEPARTKTEWVLPFMAREVASVLAVTAEELEQGESPVECLRNLCRRVEARFPTQSEPRRAVDALLRLGEP